MREFLILFLTWTKSLSWFQTLYYCSREAIPIDTIIIFLFLRRKKSYLKFENLFFLSRYYFPFLRICSAQLFLIDIKANARIFCHLFWRKPEEIDVKEVSSFIFNGENARIRIIGVITRTFVNIKFYNFWKGLTLYSLLFNNY